MKKVLFTVLDMVVALAAHYWCFWLVYYYAATIDGAIVLRSPYVIFERNYLVPAQIFVIPIIITIVSVALYRNLRMKKLIGRKYIALVLFNVIPLYVICVFQIMNFYAYWKIIY